MLVSQKRKVHTNHAHQLGNWGPLKDGGILRSGGMLRGQRVQRGGHADRIKPFQVLLDNSNDSLSSKQLEPLICSTEAHTVPRTP